MAKGRPAGLRLEMAVRTQIEFEQSSLDDLLSPDHRARQVWDYVEGLDLSALYARVQTTVSSSGRPAIDPAILVSLWLYATLEGVGSARLLDRLCRSDAAYRWLLGGVTVNYHTLSDFRTGAGEVLNRLLSSSIAGLIISDVVRVDTLAVDGMKLQAAANRGTFRRSERLAMLERAAYEVLERLAAEVNEDPAEAQRRTLARRLAVAQDRVRRLEKAREAQVEIERQREAQRQKQRRKEKPRDPDKEARASTVDPEARLMKMADGSVRPAYNVQFVTAAKGAHIVGVRVTDRGSDHGLLEPAVKEIEQRYGVKPARLLADGGYISKEDIENVHALRVELFSPLPKSKGDPAAPKRGDEAGTIAWRRRMASDEAMAIYRKRFSTERPHAHMRNRGLRQLLVRGREKVEAVVLWHVHAFNFLQFTRPRSA
jgi:transposase